MVLSNCWMAIAPTGKGTSFCPLRRFRLMGTLLPTAIGLDGVTEFFPFAQVVRQVAKIASIKLPYCEVYCLLPHKMRHWLLSFKVISMGLRSEI